MSPILFEYNGIKLRFFSHDHLPIHVHAVYADRYGMKVEFIKKNDKIIDITYHKLKGRDLFEPAQMRDLKKLIETYKYTIVGMWYDAKEDNKKIKGTKINKKL